MSSTDLRHASSAIVGSLDGTGAGDHDQPYRRGRRPRLSATYPFNTRQYARLLILRSRVQAGLVGEDDDPCAVRQAVSLTSESVSLSKES